MMKRRVFARVFAVLLASTSVPAVTAIGQTLQSGTIGGVVRDSSGAVLPGVTVEVSSPALIEKVRAGVTDGQGEYKIISLTPGVYTVTFTLPGFSVIKREGLEVSAGVTVAANVELHVGSLEETITVSGQTPLVDVQNSTQHRVISRQVFEGLPSGGYWTSTAVLLPGVTTQLQDVGGLATRGVKQQMAVHGSLLQDMPQLFDGMRFAAVWATGGGVAGSNFINSGMIQELAVDTSGATAEAEGAGVRVNIIPKQGGNRFSSTTLVNYSNDKLQGSNVDDQLRARGVSNPAVTNKLWEFNPTIGGPIKRDRLWFFFSYDWTGAVTTPPGLYYALNPTAYLFTPDTNREQPQTDTWNRGAALRLTLQTTRSSKLTLYGDHAPRHGSTPSATTVYEASTYQDQQTTRMLQAAWTWTASNRLLFEVGQTWRPEHWRYLNEPGISYDLVGILDGGLGITYRAPISQIAQVSHNYSGRASASYVTGSHSVKVGSDWFWGDRVFWNRVQNTNYYYNFTNGVPTAITQRATPTPAADNVKLDLGLFAQDQYTLKRLTFNLGVRFDYLNAYTPAQSVGPVTFVGPRSFPAFEDRPNWKDIDPRFGATFDPFGNGKTAIKGTVGRYAELQAVGITEVANPLLATAGVITTRAWNDANGNFIPDCVLTDFAANGECGPINNANFGQSIISTSYAPGVVTGWGTRGYNWEVSGAIQHEVRPGLSVEASYHRRWYGNFRVLTNTLVNSTRDFTPYCVTAPTDPRLPGGGGNQVCGLYDITPTKFGLSNNVWVLTDDPAARQVYNGADVTVNVRLPRGVVLHGGVNTGRMDTAFTLLSQTGISSSVQYQALCFTVPGNTPQLQEFCNERPPFQTQVKFFAIYPLPRWGLETSASFQSLPGPAMTASWAAPAAAITPSLGRSLSGGARTATVQLIRPNTVFGDRLNQTDFRVAKNFRVGSLRLQGQVDLYNLFNANPVIALNTTYGANWLRPINVLTPRMGRVGLLINF
jgi:hypothetical protein